MCHCPSATGEEDRPSPIRFAPRRLGVNVTRLVLVVVELGTDLLSNDQNLWMALGGVT